MLKLPVVKGVIRRRLLVNYRVDPEAIAPILPEGFRPKLQGGHAIAGICLIRLEEIRPKALPAWAGIASENAAHRIAVEWDQEGITKEGVFIPRRDTSSLPNYLAGGRLFPGEHHFADFTVTDRLGEVRLTVTSRDGSMSLDVQGTESDTFPPLSCFSSLAESSAFFESGSLGYSATRSSSHLDALRLEAEHWKVRSLDISRVTSSFFDAFPDGSTVFDHALIMRDIPHEWHEEKTRQLTTPA